MSGHDSGRYDSHDLASRYHPSWHQAHGCLLALLPYSWLGPGGDRAAGDGRGVRGVGRGHRHDDAQSAAGSELLQGNPFFATEAQTAGSAGLARLVGVQSSLLRRRGVRLRASARFSARSESAGVPERHRGQRAAPADLREGPVNSAPLGVFDSGIGGLTVARALFERLPRESVIYFGDTARVPYGPKSPDTVRRYAAEILAYLLQRGVKALVVACNTITAQALAYLQERSPVPLVGVIEPGARAAVQATRTGTIGVIGTAGTVASGAYERAITAIRPGARVHARACPLFVPLVEEGWFDHPATELIAREYLEPLRRAGVESLVLGCTHYPLLKPLLARVMGPDVTLVDSAEETAKVVARELEARGLLAGDGHHEHVFVVSDDEPHFRKVGARFLGERLKKVEVVPLG